jgi:CRISPR-associated protein Cas2
LPVVESEERKEATAFRNFLLEQGFEMAQFSVYLRFCTGPEHTETLIKRIRDVLPPGGKVDCLFFTDKQYENIVSFHNGQREPARKNPEQLLLF